MPSQTISSVENNFTKGLVTEFTGMNFPENAATDTDNCEYTLIGDVTRRLGIDHEVNHTFNSISRVNSAIATYKWNNVGGDGLTQLVVEQVGSTLYFYKSSVATTAAPLSAQRLTSTVDISSFVVSGGSFDPAVECQFSDGNGFLFVYNTNCDPFYCSYTSGVITGTLINIQIRDFIGVPEPGSVTGLRPTVLTQEHLYNLTNQGWTQGAAWNAFSPTGVSVGTGSKVFTVAAGLGVTLGDNVDLWTNIGGPFGPNPARLMIGNVTSYSGTTLTVNISIADPSHIGFFLSNWTIIPNNHGYLSTWNTSLGNYPSNSDVWWYYKDTANVFNPALTYTQVSVAAGAAPKGHYILPAFNQDRTFASSVSGITAVTTNLRPSNGAWFQGRVWYTGLNDSQSAQGDAGYYSWSENIYFSQTVTDASQFGLCYQTNDPTSENLFDLLPTDGGVITIQGSGPIYKLFPLMNAMLVFAANGVWYITGSAGIGFAANDYTIVKLSAVESISSTSFVDVQGLPMFWNEEGIYKVAPAKQGQGLLNSPLHVNPLEVMPLTIGTILTFYNNIPLSSKKYVRGAYDPINYVIQWVYRDTEASDITGRYTYNKILNYNNANNAFFPYTVDTSVSSINGIIYVISPGGTAAAPSSIKFVSSNATQMSFADEHDTNYNDWNAFSYSSSFTTGYKLHGQAQKRFQIPYIYMYYRLNGQRNSSTIQGIWDYATSGNTGRWSTAQLINIYNPNYSVVPKRVNIRGRGLVLQIKVSSVDNLPFDVIGWSVYETVNVGV